MFHLFVIIILRRVLVTSNGGNMFICWIKGGSGKADMLILVIYVFFSPWSSIQGSLYSCILYKALSSYARRSLSPYLVIQRNHLVIVMIRVRVHNFLSIFLEQ